MRSSSAETLRVALVGAGNRARDYYVPLLTRLPGFTPVGCVGRSQERATAVAAALGVPAFRDLDAMLARARPDFVVSAVPYHANGALGRELAERGVHFLSETPLAHQLADGDAIVELARAKGLIVGVAEQFPRFPVAALTRAAIAHGIFGRVLHAASDFAGHGYHGMALARSLLGLDRQPVQALGVQRSFPVASHWSRIEGRHGRDRERWDMGSIELADGGFLSFLFTDHGYDSPLRWHRQVRFFATHGMGVDDRLAVLDEDGREPHTLATQWETVEANGRTWVRALRLTAPPWRGGATVEWRNPFPHVPLRDDEIAVAQCLADMAAAIRDGEPLVYDAAQGLLDQECTLAIERSHEHGGAPCRFPLERG